MINFVKCKKDEFISIKINYLYTAVPEATSVVVVAISDCRSSSSYSGLP